MKSASCDVTHASGIAAASSSDSASGILTSIRSCATASSAWASPDAIAITRSPGFQAVTPGPTAATSPASSRPGMSSRVPGGGG